MQTASLAVAICGIVLAAVSLGWQAATYVLTGARVRVTIRTGVVVGDEIMATQPGDYVPWDTTRRVWGHARPVVVVEAAIKGRQPVTIQRWGLCERDGTALYPVEGWIGPAVPHRLEVGDPRAQWAFDLAEEVTLAGVVENTLGVAGRGHALLARLTDPSAGERKIRGVVELSDGRLVHSRQSLPWPRSGTS